jgi:glycosyltransferase involved in cell wall biosynthesis
MRITIVLGAFLPVPTIMGGAVEKAWLALAQELARRGHEVTMISRSVPEFPKTETIEGVRHIRVRGFNTPHSLLWLKVLDLVYTLRAKAKLPVADVLVTNTFWLPAVVRKRTVGRLYVHVARFPKGQLRFYSRASRLQGPSRVVVKAIQDQAPALAGKTVMIPYPAPATVSKVGAVPFAERERIILFVGRIHPEKGIHLLVQAFAREARTLFAGWKLMIVGPTEERFGGGGAEYGASLKQLAGDAADAVTFSGPIFDAAVLEQTVGRARIFVYPSLAERGETFGLAPLEAMTRGCGVLVSNLECFRDFVEDGVTGFVFDHRLTDPVQSLTTQLGRLVADETMLARVAAAGYEKSTEYSLARVADRFLEDFEKVMESP